MMQRQPKRPISLLGVFGKMLEAIHGGGKIKRKDKKQWRPT